MTFGTKFERGDVLLVTLPFTDFSDEKQRPALVLSDADYNQTDDIILCGITTNLRQDRPCILLTQNDLAEGTLPHTSAIRPDRLFTLDQTLVRRRLGRIKPLVLVTVQQRLARILGI
jgi:mRNA interferase MazF